MSEKKCTCEIAPHNYCSKHGAPMPQEICRCHGPGAESRYSPAEFNERLVVAEQRLDRVRELHERREGGDAAYCTHCCVVWPCPTVRILCSDDTPREN